MISSLPISPGHKTGWPWTEESRSPSPLTPVGKQWPKISIITPSFNQGEFIEETIRSVILQNYPNLEYIIIDGGSHDKTLEIIEKYQDWITYWISEQDSGQSDAINKGFQKSTGELVNWICSDDILCKDALNDLISSYYNPSITLYIGRGVLIDKSSNVIGRTVSTIKRFDELIDIANYWRNDNSISQPSALYRLDALFKAGGVNSENHFTMDFELWGNLLLINDSALNVPLDIGCFRWYAGQKTSYSTKVTLSLCKTAVFLIRKNNGYSFFEKQRLSIAVLSYLVQFLYHEFRSYLGIKRRFNKLLKNGI